MSVVLNTSFKSLVQLSSKLNDNNRSFVSDMNVSANNSPIAKRFEELHAKITDNGDVQAQDPKKQVDMLVNNVILYGETEEERHKHMSDKLVKVEEHMSAEVDEFNNGIEKYNQGIFDIQSGVLEQMQEEDNRSRTAQKNILKQSEEKVHALMLAVVLEREQTTDLFDKNRLEQQQRVYELQDRLQAASKLRKERETNLIQTIDSNISNITKTLNAERKARKETEEVLFRTLDELNTKLSKRVDIDRDERERTEDQMIKLLGQVCNKYESSVISRKQKIVTF